MDETDIKPGDSVLVRTISGYENTSVRTVRYVGVDNTGQSVTIYDNGGILFAAPTEWCRRVTRVAA